MVPKILGLEQIEPLLEPDGLRAVMAEVLMELSAGRAAAPARIAAHSAEGLLAAMPGQAAGVLGAKLVTVFPGNAAKGLPGHQALVALFDAGDGLPLALLEGTAITTARTAAVSAVAADALARRDAGVLAIIGTGVQAEGHWRAVGRVRNFREVRVAGRTPAKVAARAAAWGAVASANVEEAVKGADVVCCCTHAAEPVLRREWLAPGAHVNSVGIGGCELDAATIAGGRLVVESAVAFAPFPGGAYELQGLDAAMGVELGAVLAGNARGRTSADEITVFKSIGHAVEDVAAAAWVLRRHAAAAT